MSTIAGAFRLWSARRVLGQRGLALVYVLCAQAVFFVTITALIGLLLVTVRVTDLQATSNREQLALDGAIEVAANQLRFLPGSDFSDPCGVDSGFQQVQQVRVGDGAGGELVVDVDCENGELGSASSTADAVRLVGYGGYNPPAETRDPGMVWQNWTTQWTAVAGSVPTLDQQPNLVHRGSAPLRFDSGVTVRNGAAVVREGSGTPALAATGQFIQGSRGPMAAPGSSGAAACGILAGVGGLNEASRISDLDGVPECDSASARNVDRSPTDAQAGFAITGEFAGGLAPMDPAVNSSSGTTGRCAGNGTPNENVVEFFPGRYTQAMVDKMNLVTATTGSNCRSRTYWFRPGVYYFDAAELKFHNRASFFVMGRPLCWDPDLAPVPADTQVFLGVRNPNNRLSPRVIADARCWDGTTYRDPFLNPSATLCDPQASGVTFVLSPRTRITHRGGYLSMCPARDERGRQLPALYQETSVDNSVEVTLPQAARDSRGYPACTDANSVFWVDIRTNAERTGSDGSGNSRCAHQRSYRVGVRAKAGNPISSAELLLTGYQVGSYGQDGGEGHGPNNFIDGRLTRVEVRGPGNAFVCTTGWLNGMPTGISGAPMTASFDLKDPSGPLPPSRTEAQRCAAALTSSSQLADEGTELVIFHRLVWFMRDLGEIALMSVVPDLAQDYVTSAAELVLNAAPMVLQDDPPGAPAPLSAAQKLSSPASFGPTAATVPNAAGPVAAYDDVANVLVADGNVATPRMECEQVVCPINAAVNPSTPFVHDLGMRRLTMPLASEYQINNIDPNVETLRLSIGFDPSGDLPEISLAQMVTLEGPLGDLARAILANVDAALAPLASRAQWSWFLRDMQLRAELRRPTGETICRATSGPVASVQTISIDLLADGDCDGVIQSYADLQNVDLHLSVAMPCVRDPQAPRTRCMRWSGNTILQVRPPAIDHVQIRATTDSWAGTRPHSEATVNVFTTAQVPSSNSDYGAAFNVAGKAWLPLHDFDIHWRGRTTGERPLFSGDLVLNGLASRTYVPYTPLLPIGVVCCDEPRPDTRTVLLTASIDGVDKLQATVRFSDVRQADGDPDSWVEDIGHNVEVLDWRRL